MTISTFGGSVNKEPARPVKTAERTAAEFAGREKGRQIKWESMWLSNAEFDRYVCQAIDSLEESFRNYIEEVPVIVEDVPDETVCEEVGLKKSEVLLGLFRGVPLNRQSVETVGLHSPNQIFLYRQNILKCCRSVKQVAEQIRKTVVHELGHYLGFSEAELRKYQY